ESGIDKLNISEIVNLGALDANNDGLVDNSFLTSQSNGLLLDLSTSGGGKVALNNVNDLSTSDLI
ncbi:MAG: hypothetical protein F6K11_32680, partial [Leptolyngbya sp. SIO3F4]|nr:hypothetical protein [Leptolyngbya sp. SIO3F4]